VYGGFGNIVDGLADMCATLDTPVVGGNVSLYNDSETGPIPPTPTLAVAGVSESYDAPTLSLAGEGDLLLVGDRPLDGEADPRLGGSEYLNQFGGDDRFPTLPKDPKGLVSTIVDVATDETTLATHDVSHGGLAVALAEMVTGDVGADVSLDGPGTPPELLFHEQPGRVVVETTDPRSVREAFDGVAPVAKLGRADETGTLSLNVDGTALSLDADEIVSARSVIAEALE
jgi:phosphoribosylformylglycinamidine synthase